MQQMIAELGLEDVYIFAFLIVAVLAAIIFMVVFVRGIVRRDKEQLERERIAALSASPYAAPGSTNPGLDGSALTPELVTRARDAEHLSQEEAMSGPHKIDLPPGVFPGDVPADILARKGGSLPLDPTAPKHTPEQIKKHEPKSLSSALVNTRGSFIGRIKSLFGSKPKLEGAELEELEEILYTSDLGPMTVQRLLAAVETRMKADGSSGFESVRAALKTEMLEIFAQASRELQPVPPKEDERHLRLVAPEIEASENAGAEYIETLENLAIWGHKPAVIMVVGVNGAGKTTTIGKLSRRIAQSGRKVMVAAGDTFRAAAGDQLKIWTERAQVEIYNPEGVTDPSAVAYQACEEAIRKGFDVVIVDTAGRLHTQKNLMEELKKMKRVLTKLMPYAPNEVLLVLDANSGQNALIQAREYNAALQVTGVVLTKLDGTAKGGVAVGLASELQIPIKLIGVGEGIDDLRRFSPQEFVESIL